MGLGLVFRELSNIYLFRSFLHLCAEKHKVLYADRDLFNDRSHLDVSSDAYMSRFNGSILYK